MGSRLGGGARLDTACPTQRWGPQQYLSVYQLRILSRPYEYCVSFLSRGVTSRVTSYEISYEVRLFLCGHSIGWRAGVVCRACVRREAFVRCNKVGCTSAVPYGFSFARALRRPPAGGAAPARPSLRPLLTVHIRRRRPTAKPGSIPRRGPLRTLSCIASLASLRRV